jgi:hypothetical protein
MDHAAGQGVLIWVNAPPAKRINLEMSLLLFGRKPGCPISRALRRIRSGSSRQNAAASFNLAL